MLGPMLFTVYVSPIGRAIAHHKYTDDTQLYAALTTPFNVGLERLAEWTASLQH